MGKPPSWTAGEGPVQAKAREKPGTEGNTQTGKQNDETKDN
jgi:hypothetical protein